ncbi:MAG: hypothetical protein HOK06_04820 [Rhodospirillaceae bacterium]|jgi:hypothetical protein|nr:hypothetical protein [Rhodospirillaceae bacterium]
MSAFLANCRYQELMIESTLISESAEAGYISKAEAANALAGVQMRMDCLQQVQVSEIVESDPWPLPPSLFKMF